MAVRARGVSADPPTVTMMTGCGFPRSGGCGDVGKRTGRTLQLQERDRSSRRSEGAQASEAV
eukprot:723484-Prymnesium_polylepis.1